MDTRCKITVLDLAHSNSSAVRELTPLTLQGVAHHPAARDPPCPVEIELTAGERLAHQVRLLLLTYHLPLCLDFLAHLHGTTSAFNLTLCMYIYIFFVGFFSPILYISKVNEFLLD